MKQFFAILVLGLVLQSSVFSQGVINFNINFGGTPPPHTPGVPNSGATLTSDSFYAAVYLGDVTPTSGFIVEKLAGGSFAPVFQFPSPVFAAYPSSTGAAYSYEGSWQLTDVQIQNLLTGQWYA